MALTATLPTDYAPAYNPVILVYDSPVRDDFTIGNSKTITSIGSNNGYVQLNFSVAHGLLEGMYVRVTVAPGATGLIGVGRVSSVVDSDSLVIDKPFINALTGNGTAYKYIKDYGVTLSFYIYIFSNPSTPLLASVLTIKPRFVGGFCQFKIDLSGLIKDYNYNGFSIDDVLASDLFPIDGTVAQLNKKSFVKYGFEGVESYTGQNGYIDDQDPSTE